ncbi:MAG: transposase family protein [Actinobacteria bacterium]|nr:transposase family protein [Actinomycetota bacterium]
MVVTLKYLRRNRTQDELAEDHGVSQPTISRAIAALTVVLGQVLAGGIPTADDLDPNSQYIEGYSRMPIDCVDHALTCTDEPGDLV